MPKTIALLPNRLACIDGLRGVAVLMVVLFHSSLWAAVGVNFSNFYNLGRPGVDLFLVLSGFCLFWPMIDSDTKTVKPLNHAAYARRRYRRIAPPFYCALAFFTAAAFFVYRFGRLSWIYAGAPFQAAFPLHLGRFVLDLLAHLTFIHGFFKSFAHSFDGAFWSLSLEMQFYFLLPVLIWVARRYSVIAALTIPIVVSLLFRATAQIFNPAFLATYVGNEICFGRWAEFGCGMIAAYWVAIAKHRHQTPKADARFRFAYCTIAALVAEHYCGTSWWLPFIWGLAGGVAVTYPLLYDGDVRRFLSRRWLVFIGTISYSLYLIHGTIYLLLTIPLTYWRDVNLRYCVFLIAAPLLAIGAAYSFHLRFERPFMSSRPPVNQREAEIAAIASPAP